MLNDEYVLVLKQFDKNKQVEKMVLKPPPVYTKNKRNYVLLTARLLHFVKYLLMLKTIWYT